MIKSPLHPVLAARRRRRLLLALPAFCVAAALAGSLASGADTNDVASGAASVASTPTNDAAATLSNAVVAAAVEALGTNSVVPINSLPGTNTLQAIETNMVAHLETGSTNGAPVLTGWAAYKIIAEKNIFDSTRQPKRSRANSLTSKPVKTDWFSLCGIMGYEKGEFAVFVGSSSDYSRTLRVDGLIAGYHLAEIDPPDKVVLESGGKKTEVKMGQSLRRRGDEGWKLSDVGASTGDSSPRVVAKTENKTSGDDGRGSDESASPDEGEQKTAASVETKSAGGDDEVLKRLLRKREQE